MSDNAVKSNGITVGWSTNDSDYYTIGEVTDIELPGLEADEHETSDQSSNAKTYLGGMVDGGEFSTTLNVKPNDTQHKALRAVVGDTIYIRVTLPAAIVADNQLRFHGPLKVWGPITSPMSGVFTAPFSVKVSGSHTWATV